jgi:hypothetical protein
MCLAYSNTNLNEKHTILMGNNLKDFPLNVMRGKNLSDIMQ